MRVHFDQAGTSRFTHVGAVEGRHYYVTKDGDPARAMLICRHVVIGQLSTRTNEALVGPGVGLPGLGSPAETGLPLTRIAVYGLEHGEEAKKQGKAETTLSAILDAAPRRGEGGGDEQE